MRRVGGDKTSITTALVLVLCGPLSLRAERPAVAPAATKIDRASAFGEGSLPHGHVYIHVNKAGVGNTHAVVCQMKQGTLHWGATRSAGLRVVDMQRMDADSSQACQYIDLNGETTESTREQVNKDMRGNGALQVAKYPTTPFVIDSAIEIAAST